MAKKQSTRDQRVGKVFKRAEQLQRLGFNWVQINNALMGPCGIVLDLFPDRGERQEFLSSAAAKELHEIMAEAPLPDESGDQETNGRILVRMPKSLHAALMDEAKSEGVSLNQLIVSKLAAGLKTVV